MLRRASTHYDEANALTNTASGGRRCPGHGVVEQRRTPARLCVGLKLYRAPVAARVDAGSRWDDGGAVMVMEKRLGKPVTGTVMAASGAAAAGATSDEGEPGNAKWRRGQERVGAGDVKACTGLPWPHVVRLR